MKRHAALITGACGAIGESLCAAFHREGWYVIASDISENCQVPCDYYIKVDLSLLCTNSDYADDKLSLLRSELPDKKLDVLINNAAIQVVAPLEEISAESWRKTFDINLIAPALLVRDLINELEAANGSVINIASIHSNLTKPDFSAYASSKAALVGLTRSLAIELGQRIRVNAISPAAIKTPMLEEGFRGTDIKLSDLEKMHPVGRIGQPSEISALALFLASEAAGFINGAEIGIDGGIRGRLHDPV